MALAGANRLFLGLVFLWSAAALISVGDAWKHWHQPGYTEADEAYETRRSVIQPVVKKSAQLATHIEEAHPRFRRDTLPISYRSLSTADETEPDVAPHCAAWSQSHFKTFDGKIYNFHGACKYTLFMDCDAFSFRIAIQNDFECFTPGTGASCNRTVLVSNGVSAMPVYLRPGTVVGHDMAVVELPTTLDGMVLERVGDSIVVTSGLGFKLIYDGDEAVTVYLTSDALRGKTCGLCGVYNDDPSDDFKGPFGSFDNAYDFGLSWKDDIGCEDIPRPAILCTQIFIPPHLVHLYKGFIDLANFARSTCKKLEHDAAFTRCHSAVEVMPYLQACQRDVCNCKLGEGQCACNSLTAYAQECARFGVVLDWRSPESCPWTCPAGTIYSSCGTTCTRMCGSAASDCEEDSTVGCIEGCRCPADQYQNSHGQCVKEEDCPCVINGEDYDTGATISDGCNQCTCNSGKWTCTEKICETICWAAGDPHFKTFDDTYFDFMGECSYHLVKDCWDENDKFEVIVENAPCGHPGVTCPQKVTVKDVDDDVTLFKDHAVAVNGYDVTDFPYVIGDIMVDRPTNLLTVVSLGNGMAVRWDGDSRVEVIAPPAKFNRTCGLCGTFNKNPADDFMTPDGERVVSVDVFGNSWKVSGISSDACPDTPGGNPPDVCELFSQRKQAAHEHCNKLITQAVFQACHRVLDPGPYVLSCRYDFCNGDGNDDHCTMFSQYVSDCRHKGVFLEGWRKVVPECDAACDEPGMTFSECAPSCGASCASLWAIGNGAQCVDVCVEGCHCDNGKVLGHDGNCIPSDQCPCYDEFQWYDSGETIKRNCQTCVCHGGDWQCDEVTCPPITCPSNQFYSECSFPVECQPTCENFNDPPVCSGECTRACECVAGYVLHNGECVTKAECPCSYRGEVYDPNDVIKVGCKICTCRNGEMECHNQFCPGTCITWGDPHYQTFDGKKYSFQGECEYVMVTNSHYPEAKQFHIIVANIPCGSTGVTCTKSVVMSIGTGAEQERVMLIRGKPIEVDTGVGGLSEFTITEAGLYIFVHTNIGVTLMWDRATRVEVKVSKEHFSRVGGLCGNFNDIQSDDFLPPGGGIPLIDPNDFGNSWKVHDYCGKPGPQPNPCDVNPHRRTWAQKKCGIINSYVFQPCHEYVPPALYYSNCVFDACGCDSGGDCECMCTAIAVYAQACNEHGVPIKWRTQDLCPIQCEGCLTYDPCIPVCESSCENLPFVFPGASGSCSDTCVDGCICPPGTILHEDQCVEECPPIPTTVVPTFKPTPERPTTMQPPVHTTTEAPTTEYQPEPTTPEDTCVCWGYGDPHYFDFNGVEFDDQGECTYVLTQDIQEPPRFVILIHNVECNLMPGQTCPTELEILYDNHKIRMLSERTALGKYQAVIDGTTHTLPVDSYDSFTLHESGSYILFDAPSIDLEVRFLPIDLHFFRVEIPRSVYFNSTEGLCGNCGNPEPPCQETETCCEWLAPPHVPSECGCDVKPTDCTPTQEVIEWCDKLYEDKFSDCHGAIDPEQFHKNCLYNNCHALKLMCWDFEAYALECSLLKLCLDWREDDFCPFVCDNDQMHHRECVCPDDVDNSCYPWDTDPHHCQKDPVSGCFCDEGTMDNGNGSCVVCSTEAPTKPSPTTKFVPVTTSGPEFTTLKTTPPAVTTKQHPPETTPPASTTVEPTTPMIESTTLESTTVKTTPPAVTTKPHPPATTPPASTTVEPTTPMIESTTLESTTVKTTPPQATTKPQPPATTPPASTTVEPTTPMIESTTLESTTVKTTPPQATTKPQPPATTPPASTTVEPTTPMIESTTLESTTVKTTPPQATTKPQPPETTPPASTTVELTTPMIESTTLESTTVKTTPPQATTKPQPPETTPPASTTVEPTTPMIESTTLESTTVKTTPPQATTKPHPPETTPQASTTVEPTPESTTGVFTVEYTTVVDTTPKVVETTTMEAPHTTECVPGFHRICKWSQYLDDELGQPKTNPYEFELIEDFLNDEGYSDVCAEPENIECVLAKDHSVPASMTTQFLKCTPDLGLVCYDGDTQICLDYAIRVHCCEETYVHCGSTESPTTTVIPTEQESTTVIESTTIVESTTLESTPPATTTVEPSTEEPKTTVCVPHYEDKCEWTNYFDDSDSPHGDFEVIGDLRDNHPGEICENPEAIECVLSSDHSVSAHEAGQNFTCLTSVGFLCLDFANNRRQPYECYDYAVRFLCCETVYESCGSTEQPTTTKVVVPTTAPVVPTTETEAPTTIIPTTTECVEVVEKDCQWSPWLDDEGEDKVGSLGELELISSYREEYEICDKPSNIECVLKHDPSIHANETLQVVTCNVDEGLVCLHSEQTDFPPFCFDYKIRVQCCKETVIPCPGVTTTKQVPTTKQPEVTTEEAPSTTPEEPTTKQVPTTKQPEVTTEEAPSTTPEEPTTKQVPTTKQPEVTTEEAPSTTPEEPTTKQVPTTKQPEVTTEEAPSTTPEEPTTEQPKVTTEEAAPTTKQVPTTKQPEVTTEEAPSTTPEEPTTEEPKVTTAEAAPTTKQVPTTKQPEVTTEEAPYTTPCKPVYEEVCEWLPWMDDDEGKVGPIGEFELISTFREQYDICDEPQDIQCALKSDHSLLVNMTKQNLLCSPSEGLICLHNDQPEVPRCFDFSIRLKCCKFVNIGCPTTPQPVVTTIESSTETVPSTTGYPHNNEKCGPVMTDKPTTIIKNGCSSAAPVFLPQCFGRCESHSSFDGFNHNGQATWNNICRCCRPTAYETDHYELICPDGETVTQPVDIVSECSCTEYHCPPM